tara:strand:+ start:2334 stop:2714 length:381 start_codon:yes stop_codon:yes gene_type:complete
MNDTEKKKMSLLLCLVIIVNIYFVSRIPKPEGFGTHIVTPFVKDAIRRIPKKGSFKGLRKFLLNTTKKSTDETILQDISIAGFKLILMIAIVPFFALFFAKAAVLSAGHAIIASFAKGGAFMVTSM